MIKELIIYKIIKSYCCILEVMLKFNIINQMCFTLSCLSGHKSLTLTQLMNIINLHLATVDLCDFMSS